MKLSQAQRLQKAEYKRANWTKVKDYARTYMREWRSREPGKTIIRVANAAYYERNKLALAMYQQLRNLAKAENAFGRGKQRRKLGLGRWEIAA